LPDLLNLIAKFQLAATFVKCVNRSYTKETWEVPDFHTLFGDHEKAHDETSAMEETTLRIKEVNVRRFWTQELVAIHLVVASLQAGTRLVTFQQLLCGVAFLPVSVRLYIFQMHTYMYPP
jgi:hypothetical protein